MLFVKKTFMQNCSRFTTELCGNFCRWSVLEIWAGCATSCGRRLSQEPAWVEKIAEPYWRGGAVARRSNLFLFRQGLLQIQRLQVRRGRWLPQVCGLMVVRLRWEYRRGRHQWKRKRSSGSFGHGCFSLINTPVIYVYGETFFSKKYSAWSKLFNLWIRNAVELPLVLVNIHFIYNKYFCICILIMLISVDIHCNCSVGFQKIIFFNRRF